MINQNFIVKDIYRENKTKNYKNIIKMKTDMIQVALDCIESYVHRFIVEISISEYKFETAYYNNPSNLFYDLVHKDRVVESFKNSSSEEINIDKEMQIAMNSICDTFYCLSFEQIAKLLNLFDLENEEEQEDDLVYIVFFALLQKYYVQYKKESEKEDEELIKEELEEYYECD